MYIKNIPKIENKKEKIKIFLNLFSLQYFHNAWKLPKENKFIKKREEAYIYEINPKSWTFKNLNKISQKMLPNIDMVREFKNEYHIFSPSFFITILFN